MTPASRSKRPVLTLELLGSNGPERLRVLFAEPPWTAAFDLARAELPRRAFRGRGRSRTQESLSLSWSGTRSARRRVPARSDPSKA